MHVRGSNTVLNAFLWVAILTQTRMTASGRGGCQQEEEGKATKAGGEACSKGSGAWRRGGAVTLGLALVRVRTANNATNLR